MTRNFLSLLPLLLFLLVAPAFAASSDPAPPSKEENRVPGPMVLPQAWPGGDTMPARILAVMNHFSFSYNEPRKGTSPYTMKVPAGPGREIKVGPKSSDQFVNVFKLRYAITDRFEARTATPFINADIKMHNADGDWRGGLGDTTLMLRYGLIKRTDDLPFSLALDAGVTLPTGEVGDKDKYLATNAFSAIVGAGASWVDKNQRVDLDGRYAAYTEGAHGIKPGDFALFHAHYAYALSRNFDLGAEAYYRFEQASEVNGKNQRYAFQEAYIGPKIQIKVPEFAYMMLGAAVLFPAYRYSDSMRLSTDTRYEFSILFAF